MQWLAQGFHGDMHYMAAHGLKRARPAELVPGTVSVITARMDYLPRDRDSAPAVAHAGGWGMGTVQGAYSARSGSQVISARTPRLHRSATNRWVNTSVPVPVRTVGNQMAGAAVFIRISTLSLWVFARLQYVPQFFPHHWPCKLCRKGAGAGLPCAGVIGQHVQRGLGQGRIVPGRHQVA